MLNIRISLNSRPVSECELETLMAHSFSLGIESTVALSGCGMLSDSEGRIS